MRLFRLALGYSAQADLELLHKTQDGHTPLSKLIETAFQITRHGSQVTSRTSSTRKRGRWDRTEGRWRRSEGLGWFENKRTAAGGVVKANLLDLFYNRFDSLNPAASSCPQTTQNKLQENPPQTGCVQVCLNPVRLLRYFNKFRPEI